MIEPKTMDMEKYARIGQAYLRHLEAGKLEALLQLFSPDARVLSPLYGEKPAKDFYAELLADTRQSRLTHLQTFTAPDPPQLALFFRYEWTLASGERTEFEVVDVLSLDESGSIRELNIIYDTSTTRSAWRRDK